MKKNFNKVISLILCFCVILGACPFMRAEAINLQSGTFNPLTSSIIIDFNLQYTQHVSVEVLVNGAHFGWLINNQIMTGYDGAMSYHDPDNASYTIPTPSDTTHTAGTASASEATVKTQDGKGDGYYEINWNGSIQGKPVVAVAPTSDSFAITISIQPKGYPEIGTNGIIPNTYDKDGNNNHDGQDWIWTQQFAVTTVPPITIDLATILKQNGLSDSIKEMKDKGLSESEMQKQLGQICNWASMDKLLELYEDSEQQDPNSKDPVNLIDGNYHFSYTDLKLEGQCPLTFDRLYSSTGWKGSFGNGFTSSFDYKLVNNDGYVHVYLPGGEQLVFLSLRSFESAEYYTVQNREYTLTNTSSGGYLMKYKRGGSYEFDSSGRLIDIQNDTGLTVYTLTYSGSQLSRVSGMSGYMDMTWSGNCISKVTDSAGRSVTYGYAGDNLTSVTNPDSSTLNYTYDSNNYLATASDFEGKIYAQNTYDTKGRVTKQIFTNANVDTINTFSYDDTNLVNTYTNAQGRQTAYHYDQYRNLLYSVNADGTTTSGYSNNIASSLKDNQGNSSTYGVDGSSNVTSMTIPTEIPLRLLTPPATLFHRQAMRTAVQRFTVTTRVTSL